jgi:hypothetical protein
MEFSLVLLYVWYIINISSSVVPWFASVLQDEQRFLINFNLINERCLDFVLPRTVMLCVSDIPSTPCELFLRNS